MTSPRMRDASADTIVNDFAEKARAAYEADPNTQRAVAVGTAWGQITYAMLCLREGRADRALEALQEGKDAINAACPHLSDFWIGRENVFPIGRADVAEVGK